MPDFSRRHYKQVAEIIRGCGLDPYSNLVQHPCREGSLPCPLVMRMIELFQQDNPLFDKEKFAKACSV